MINSLYWCLTSADLSPHKSDSRNLEILALKLSIFVYLFTIITLSFIHCRSITISFIHYSTITTSFIHSSTITIYFIHSSTITDSSSYLQMCPSHDGLLLWIIFIRLDQMYPNRRTRTKHLHGSGSSHICLLLLVYIPGGPSGSPHRRPVVYIDTWIPGVNSYETTWFDVRTVPPIVAFSILIVWLESTPPYRFPADARGHR